MGSGRGDTNHPSFAEEKVLLTPLVPMSYRLSACDRPSFAGESVPLKALNLRQRV